MERVIGIWLVRVALTTSAGFAFGSSAHLLVRAALDGRRVRRLSLIGLVKKIGLVCLLGTVMAAIGAAMANR